MKPINSRTRFVKLDDQRVQELEALARRSTCRSATLQPPSGEAGGMPAGSNDGSAFGRVPILVPR
jgi:hypothetical protein